MPQQITLSIDGMSCQSCADSITNALSKLGDIHTCHIDLDTKLAVIDYAGDLTSHDIIDAITGLGFDVSPQTTR